MKYLCLDIKGFGFCLYAHNTHTHTQRVCVRWMDIVGIYHAARNTFDLTGFPVPVNQHRFGPARFGLVVAELRLTLATPAYLLHSRR